MILAVLVHKDLLGNAAMKRLIFALMNLANTVYASISSLFINAFAIQAGQDHPAILTSTSVSFLPAKMVVSVLIVLMTTLVIANLDSPVKDVNIRSMTVLLTLARTVLVVLTK